MIRCLDSLPCSQSPLARIPDRCSSLNQIFFLTGRPVFLWKETNIAKFHFNQDARTTALWNRQSSGVFFTSYCFHVFHSLGEMITLNKNGLHPLLIAPTKINVSFFKKQQKTDKQTNGDKDKVELLLFSELEKRNSHWKLPRY